MTSAVEVRSEIRNRILISVAAYGYEILSNPIMSDADFDLLCLLIRPEISTGNETLDNFFRETFEPCTGVWIWKHPELESIRNIYEKVYGK